MRPPFDLGVVSLLVITCRLSPFVRSPQLGFGTLPQKDLFPGMKPD